MSCVAACFIFFMTSVLFFYSIISAIFCFCHCFCSICVIKYCDLVLIHKIIFMGAHLVEGTANSQVPPVCKITVTCALKRELWKTGFNICFSHVIIEIINSYPYSPLIMHTPVCTCIRIFHLVTSPPGDLFCHINTFRPCIIVQYDTAEC